MIAVPIYANHQMNGFIGVDNPDLRQNEISITLLSDVGGHLGCVRENLKSTVLLKRLLMRRQRGQRLLPQLLRCM